MNVKDLYLPYSGEQLDALAATIVRDIQPDVLKGLGAFDVEAFFDLHLERLTGMECGYSNDLPAWVYGATDVGTNKVEINGTLADSPGGVRFLRSTIAHESGHGVVHAPRLRSLCLTQRFVQEKESLTRLNRNASIPIYLNPEWQAHRFAGGLLMPSDVVRQMVRRGASTADLVEHFDVNPSFVRSRLKGLKLFTK